MCDAHLIHRFFEEAKEFVSGPIAMPFWHFIPEWNDPGIVGPEHGYKIIKHDKKYVTTGLQQGWVSFYLLQQGEMP